MSDAFEDRLRDHLAERAGQVQADPDPGALLEHAVGRSGYRRTLTMGAVSIAVVFAGLGVLTGVHLTGGRSTAAPLAAAPSTTGPGRAGAALAPDPSGISDLPATAVQAPYSSVFTRTTSSGVAIRVYATGSGTTGGCSPEDAACPPPVGTVPGPVRCPTGAVCAQPVRVPQEGGGGASPGAGTSSSPATGSPPTATTQTTAPAGTGSGSGSTGSGSIGTVPSGPTAACGQLVIELSTDMAVGSGSVPRPTTVLPSPDTVAILGIGSFGTAEGAPVGWVAVWAGSGVSSVHLSSGGLTVDAMTPISGIVVLAVPGNADLTGATVVATGQNGTAVATVPADQTSGPDSASTCTIVPTEPPATTSTDPSTTSTTSTTTVVEPPATLPTPTNGPVTSQNGR